MFKRKKPTMGPLPDIWKVARIYVEESQLASDLKSRILGALRNRDVPLVLSVCAEGDYTDLQACRSLRQVEAFFKKNAMFSNDETCLSNAQKKFC